MHFMLARDIVTHAGHSMGGALATLAAPEIVTALEQAGVKVHVSCYTFGAPRTGNHAFARHYDRKVPDTWGLINDQVSLNGDYSVH